MKKKLLTAAALLLALMFCPAALAGGGESARPELSGVFRATELYEAGEYLDAARLLEEQISALKAAGDYEDLGDGLEDLETILLPLYDWMGVTGGEARIVGTPDNSSFILGYDRSEGLTESQARNVRYGMQYALDLLQRNCLYRYYLQMEEHGADIRELEEFPYRHDRTWTEFSLALCESYPDGRLIRFLDGKKLLIQGLRDMSDPWTTEILSKVPVTRIATDPDEVGWILRFDRYYKQVTRTVNQRTGKQVGASYKYIVTVSFTDLYMGGTRVIKSYQKSPGPESSSGVSSNYIYGKYTEHDVSEIMEQDILPVLAGYIRLNSKS